MKKDALPDAVATDGKLHLFSLYVDFSASVCARRVTGAVARLAGSRWKISSEMWKLDSLSFSAPLRKITAWDAANADLIAVGVSSLEHPPLELLQWLGSLAAWKQNGRAPGLLIGLLGDKDTKTAELDWTVKPLIDCARRMEWSFIWHWMGENELDDSHWLSEHVENLLAKKSGAGRGTVPDPMLPADMASNLAG